MIRNFTPSDLTDITALQQKYTSANPGTPVIPAEVYLSPGFHQGEDIFCAYDDSSGAPRLLAYAPLYFQPAGAPDLYHTAWVEIKADPALPDAAPEKDALYDCLVQRSLALAAQQDVPAQQLRMVFQYLPSEHGAIGYVENRGFQRTESVFNMYRDLCEPVPEIPTPPGIELRFWKMASEAEQRAYIAARNECFPEAQTELEDWQYFLSSPLWAVGGSIAAFDGDQLVGNVALYWNEAENAQRDCSYAHTEYIFVRPAWRGRKIASAMIAAGLRFLQERGLQQARLEVLALNENALHLYTSLGYRVSGESRFYTRYLPL